MPASSLNLLERLRESFRRPSAIALALAFLGMNFVNAAFQRWTPTWLYQRFGFTLAEAGFHATFYHYVGAFLGVLPPRDETAVLYALREALSPEFGLRIDPNGIWSRGTAIQAAQDLEPLKLEDEFR